MFSYQKNSRFFAQISDGLESLGVDELTALGATEVKPTFRGIYFTADTASLYRITYSVRIITRILAPLITFDCHSTKYLYKTARSIHWPDLFGLDETFAVSANVSHSTISHSQYAALRVKDAIVDCFRDIFGSRPDVERIDPDISFNLHLFKNVATIYLDLSGGSLHRRGYRKESVDAPMQETLAAAIIHLTQWNGETPLYDPMCGSGTLLCEALMKYCRMPSGYLRKNFGFMHMPDFDPSLWEKIQYTSKNMIRELPKGLIAGSDRSSQAVASARSNAHALSFGERISLSTKLFQDIDRIEDSTLVCNPPYGVRIGRHLSLNLFMKEFGDFLKQRCTGSTAFVYFGDRGLIKSIGLHSSWKKPLKNGPLDGRLVRYELY